MRPVKAVYISLGLIASAAIGGAVVWILKPNITSNRLQGGQLETKELTIGFISFPIIPVEDYEDVANYLEEQLGTDVEIKLDPVVFNIDDRPVDEDPEARGKWFLQLAKEAENKVSSKTWDVAFTLTPMISLAAEEADYKFVALMNPQQRAFKSAFFVRKDNPEISSFNDFSANHTIALGDLSNPLNSPYTFYVPLFHLYGLSLKEASLNSSTQKVFELVDSGDVQIGVSVDQVVTGEAPWLPPQEKEYNKATFKIIPPRNQQKEIPPAGVFLSPELSEKDQETIAKALLAAPENIRKQGRYAAGDKPDYQAIKVISERVEDILICADWRDEPARFYC
jgi:hypothetical protein